MPGEYRKEIITVIFLQHGQNLRWHSKPSPTKGEMHVHMKPGSVAGTTSHTAFGSHGSGSHGSGSVKLGRYCKSKSHDKTKQLP